jgi:uncharacterized protein (DUF1499 family)
MQTEHASLTSFSSGRVALWTAVAAVLLLGASGPLYQLGLWSLTSGYNGVRLAVGLAAIALMPALVTLWMAVRVHSLRPLAAATLSLAIALFTIIVPVHEALRSRAAAPLHDVTTDLRNPPMFQALLDVQQASSQPRPVRLDTLQVRAYPDIGPLVLPVTLDMAFEEALETLSELDWPIADGNEDEGLIEATVHSPWFGFKDDLVVRLTPLEGQTRVDVRSVSRDGRDDGGRNAAHVREFLEELKR